MRRRKFILSSLGIIASPYILPGQSQDWMTYYARGAHYNKGELVKAFSWLAGVVDGNSFEFTEEGNILTLSHKPTTAVLNNKDIINNGELEQELQDFYTRLWQGHTTNYANLFKGIIMHGVKIEHLNKGELSLEEKSSSGYTQVSGANNLFNYIARDIGEDGITEYFYVQKKDNSDVVRIECDCSEQTEELIGELVQFASSPREIEIINLAKHSLGGTLDKILNKLGY